MPERPFCDNALAEKLANAKPARPHTCILCGQTFYSWMIFSVAFSGHVMGCVSNAFGATVADSFQGHETSADVFAFLESYYPQN